MARQRRSWGKIRKLTHGSNRWQASYMGPDLQRHTAPETFTARMDGEHWLAEERRLIERDQWTPPKARAAQRNAQSVTLSEYADKWIEQRHLKAGTAIEYRRIKARLIDPTLGKVPLRHISADAVRTWYVNLGTDTPRRNSHAYGLLHAIVKTAVTDGLLATNPCSIPKAMNTPTVRQAQILTVDELAAAADAIQPPQLRAMLLVAAWCGPRWGELIELRRRDIDDICEVITISRAVTHRGKGCVISTPKSGKGRTCIVPPHIRADLKHHLELYVGKDADALVFPALRDGCHFNDSVFAKHLAPALRTVGVTQNVRIHDLRHFAGSQTARVANLPETMGYLGHSTPKASLIYQQVTSGRPAEIAAALSALAQVPEKTG